VDCKFLKDSEMVLPAQTKIAMIVMDGSGGLPMEPGVKTELEGAHKPNLDALADLGLVDLVAPGTTPGSGPGHLSS
jgi:2,3-bisphosphoglycerate-independent phosphoglycerate mutase